MYERQINFPAKITNDVKKAWEYLKTYAHDLSKENDVLYGETVIKALDRRANAEKEPERSLKKCNQKWGA